ncbi:MAG: FAD-dependent thymidylate synthase [Vampirovibrionales bacterium]
MMSTPTTLIMTAQHIPVLEQGFVTLLDTLGNDLTVVNAARVSFGKRKDHLEAQDVKLIDYLAKHKHWSPFRHVQLQFHCKVPEFIARQWYKHVVGIAYSEGGARDIDHAWNEISLRYVDAGAFDFYVPQVFRKQSPSNKQASMDETLNPVLASGHTGIEALQAHAQGCFKLYQELVASGVAKEQARMILPLSIFTEFYWTTSLQAVVNFLKLRLHEGSQYEIRCYAQALEKLVRQVAPESVDALMRYEH